MTQFYSLAFIAFVAVLMAVYYAVGKLKGTYQWIVLLGGNLAFYLLSGWQNLFFILITSASVWLVSLGNARLDGRCKDERANASNRDEKKAIKQKYTKKKWALVLTTLILNFGILSYIKYWNALLEAVGYGDSFLASHLLLPLGISFYTFQSVGYLIDTYNGKYSPTKCYFKFLLFVSWFPQLIQGPINRFDQLATQLYERHHLDLTKTKRALLLIGFGMMKKYAIADLLAAMVAAALDHITGNTPGSFIVFGILLYSAQQYADFSGGIDIVRGVSMLFGVEMALNFKQPYFSISLADFWRRWHITLGAWMRDYVFYPFALRPSMQRFTKWATPRMGKHLGRILPACLANLLVFFLVGLWHGAESHYIAWGLYNGIVIALADLLGPVFTRMNKFLHINTEGTPHRIWCITRTFIVVNIGWYFDRIIKFDDCMTAFHNTIFNFNLGGLMPAIKASSVANWGYCLAIAALGCCIVLIVSVLRERGIDVAGKFLGCNFVVRYLCYAFVAFLVIISFVFSTNVQGFMYANF